MALSFADPLDSSLFLFLRYRSLSSGFHASKQVFGVRAVSLAWDLVRSAGLAALFPWGTGHHGPGNNRQYQKAWK